MRQEPSRPRRGPARVAYCYNSEVATMRISECDTASGEPPRCPLRDTLVAAGRPHFDHAQRRVDGSRST